MELMGADTLIRIAAVGVCLLALVLLAMATAERDPDFDHYEPPDCVDGKYCPLKDQCPIACKRKVASDR